MSNPVLARKVTEVIDAQVLYWERAERAYVYQNEGEELTSGGRAWTRGMIDKARKTCEDWKKAYQPRVEDWQALCQCVQDYDLKGTLNFAGVAPRVWSAAAWSGGQTPQLELAAVNVHIGGHEWFVQVRVNADPDVVSITLDDGTYTDTWLTPLDLDANGRALYRQLRSKGLSIEEAETTTRDTLASRSIHINPPEANVREPRRDL